MGEEKEATVIIPNWNGMAFLPSCIAALKNQTVSDFDILVIDNASEDGSVLWMERNSVPFIRENRNLGFAAAVNDGIKAAKTPYVILLNNDTEVFPGFAENLIRMIGKSRKIFSVSSMMLRFDDHDLIDDAGDGMSLLGWAFQKGTGQKKERFLIRREVFSACGGAAIYRRSIFDEIGFFDEAHFCYLEDIDIGWRAKLAGYHNLYCPAAKVLHKGSATSGSKYNDFKVRLTARNNIYLHYKNQPFLQLLLNFDFLLDGILIKAVFFARKGFAKSYFSGVFEGLSTLHRVKKVRFGKAAGRRCLAIEWEMIAGTVEYVYNYLLRGKHD